jgi:hypothetical protein
MAACWGARRSLVFARVVALWNFAECWNACHWVCEVGGVAALPSVPRAYFVARRPSLHADRPNFGEDRNAFFTIYATIISLLASKYNPEVEHAASDRN